MYRTDKKVKDLVEVKPYSSLLDYFSDPARTLAAYLFTEATSEMMAKWLDKISEVGPQSGAAKALAGYRGVGKSHFLATLGAIVSNPELRSQIVDPLVASSAQQLKRRRHPVAYVRRGTNKDLFEELKDSLAKSLEIDRAKLSDSLEELLKMAATKAGDLPFVFIIDTAQERIKRVARNDGPLLGEIAEIGKNLNIFVAVALDDDIAGADGVNAAIARTYSIDYLDQDHLYRIVNNYVFPKNTQELQSLKEVYQYFRSVLPAFQWSEQKFSSLYPLHPLILEIAPFVRLYVKEFALMGFASEAGAKILGRPANSLICLDEVFDLVEAGLRKSEELKEVFDAFDKVSSEVINQIPVLQRLQAKLVLKALLLMSLSGEGATASEISAATLVFDEGSENPSASVAEILERFAQLIPEQLNRYEEKSGQIRYCFKVAGKDSLNQALREAALGISSEVIPKVLRRFASERFNDWVLLTENEVFDSVDCNVVWRGTIRRGRIIWNWNNDLKPDGHKSDFYDWEVVIVKPGKEPSFDQNLAIPRIFWQPALLRPEEAETILRYHVLVTDESIAEEFKDQISIAGHALMTTVGKIWERIFLEEGSLIVDGKVYSFSPSAKNSRHLSDAFIEILNQIFESYYADHPVLTGTLGIAEVSSIVNELFGARKVSSPEVQTLAVNLAEPLGLVTLRGDYLVLSSEEELLKLAPIQKILSRINENNDEVFPLKDIYQELKKKPFGFSREAVQLYLSALVAKRRIEFVTSKGNRINHRSLDLKIIWDDIVGISRPETVSYSSVELVDWARTLTAVDTFRTLDDPKDREKIRQALSSWLNDWRSEAVLERFEKLPEDALNTSVWRLATNVAKTFGSVASSIEELLEESISLEECLQTIADAFSNSEKIFIDRTKDLVKLEDFLRGADLRSQVWKYLSLCEITTDETIEALRKQLLEFTVESLQSPSETLNREFEEKWNEFQKKYADYFIVRHDAVMRNSELQDRFEEIIGSDEWWEFENLSKISIFPKTYYNRAKMIYFNGKKLNCKADVREVLKRYPLCSCSFRLSMAEEWKKLPDKLREVVERGRLSYRKVIRVLRDTLVSMLEQIIQESKKKEEKQVAQELVDILQSGRDFPLLSSKEMVVLKKAVSMIKASPMLMIELPEDESFMSRAELQERFSEWFEELPDDPVLMKI
ncbi:MAG: DUF6079 family protein [Pyrinomonadaceae bacterium]|nr:DUF6079 family protein [Pyrinomonadaceae bacterium]MCX7640440.1 DUF6079 family protein [Pyrinomonadaceae bacterium]MDW8304867.1 DUF6079 family protein [Acidobacteriota bacterium]